MFSNNSDSNSITNTTTTTTTTDVVPTYAILDPFQLDIIFWVTRIISGVNIIPYIFLIITYSKRKTFNFTMCINIQLCITQLSGNISFFFPLINTPELEASIICKLQALFCYIASYGVYFILTVILTITFLNYYCRQLMERRGVLIETICCVISWACTIGLCVMDMFQPIGSGPVAYCRCSGAVEQKISIVVFAVFVFVPNLLICLMIKGMIQEKQNAKDTQERSVFMNVIQKLIVFNIPITLAIVSLVMRLNRKKYANKSQGLFVLLLVSEIIKTISGVITVCVFCFNKTALAELYAILCCKNMQTTMLSGESEPLPLTESELAGKDDIDGDSISSLAL